MILLKRLTKSAFKFIMLTMSKKIFFFDLDGTLLNSKKEITSKTMEALKRFTDAGNHFAISTGRAIDSAMDVQKELGLFFSGTFLVGYNGGQIYDCDNKELVYRAQIPLNLVKKCFDLAKEHNIHIHTYNDDHILTPDDGECIDYYRRVIKTPYIVTDDVTKELEYGPSKCIAIELHDHEKMERFREEVLKIAPDKLSVMYSNPYYLEIFPSEAGKGSAVIRLCDYLDIPIENSFAAGDEQNDISMIKAAGTGIAMLNATDMVKDNADVITESDNDHDGLAPFIEKAI